MVDDTKKFLDKAGLDRYHQKIDAKMKTKVTTTLTGSYGDTNTIDNSPGQEGCVMISKTATTQAGFATNTSGGATGILGQIYAVSIDDTSTQYKMGPRLNILQSGMYYTNGQTGPTYTADDELATKKDVKNINVGAFYGSYATKALLDAATATKAKNDYAIVLKDETQGNRTTRYRYNGTAWVYEYVIENNDCVRLVATATETGGTACLVPWKFDAMTFTTEQANIPYRTLDMSSSETTRASGTATLVLPSATLNTDGTVKTAGLYSKTVADKKLNILADASAGQPMRMPYFFEILPEATKIVVKDYTVRMNNSQIKETFTLDVPGAIANSESTKTDGKAGLMTAADKYKLDWLDGVHKYGKALTQVSSSSKEWMGTLADKVPKEEAIAAMDALANGTQTIVATFSDSASSFEYVLYIYGLSRTLIPASGTNEVVYSGKSFAYETGNSAMNLVPFDVALLVTQTTGATTYEVDLHVAMDNSKDFYGVSFSALTQGESKKWSGSKTYSSETGYLEDWNTIVNGRSVVQASFTDSTTSERYDANFTGFIIAKDSSSSSVVAQALGIGRKRGSTSADDTVRFRADITSWTKSGFGSGINISVTELESDAIELKTVMIGETMPGEVWSGNIIDGVDQATAQTLYDSILNGKTMLQAVIDNTKTSLTHTLDFFGFAKTTDNITPDDDTLSAFCLAENQDGTVTKFKVSVYPPLEDTTGGSWYVSAKVTVVKELLTGYSIATTASAVAATDTFNQAIGKLEYEVKNPGLTAKMTGYAIASAATAITVTDTLAVAIGKLEYKIDNGGASSKLTGYAIATAASAVAATDTTNSAIAKIEYRLKQLEDANLVRYA